MQWKIRIKKFDKNELDQGWGGEQSHCAFKGCSKTGFLFGDLFFEHLRRESCASPKLNQHTSSDSLASYQNCCNHS